MSLLHCEDTKYVRKASKTKYPDEELTRCIPSVAHFVFSVVWYGYEFHECKGIRNAYSHGKYRVWVESESRVSIFRNFRVDESEFPARELNKQYLLPLTSLYEPTAYDSRILNNQAY